MYFHKDKTSLYYEKYGNRKSNIIILPGWGDNRETFSYLIESLQSYFTIYILDYPGFGNSIINQDFTIYQYANIIQEWINYLNIENPILIGHSFGGRIISILTTEYHYKYKKLLLMDVAGIKYKSIKLFTKKYLYKLLKCLKIFLPKKIKTIYLNYLFKNFSSPDYRQLPTNLLKTFQNIINEDLTKYYKKINLETLIIWGELDSITPISMGLKIHKLIKNSTFIKIKNTKHFPYIEKKYLISRIIFEYLKKDII